MSNTSVELKEKTTSASSGLAVLIFVSVSFGLAFGIYESFLPLYWKTVVKMPERTMGYIFSAAAVGVFLLRIYMGSLSDIFGRKLFYLMSLIGAALSNFATPLLPYVFVQAVLKTSREASCLVRETMHSVLLYEQNAKSFIGSLGITRGAEFACHGFGSLLGGLLIYYSSTSATGVNFSTAFIFSAGLIIVAATAFSIFYRPKPFEVVPQVKKVSSLRVLFSRDLPPKLWLLVAFGFTFETGLQTTHCFIMPLYFKNMLSDVLGADVEPVKVLFGVALIMAVHRVVAGLPMMVVAPRLRKNLKGLFIVFVFLEGVGIAITPLIANPWLAIGIWLTHDMLGASVWSPIHNHYIQQYSRSESRGTDVSKVLGLSQLGRAVGPLLAGVLATTMIGSYQGGSAFFVGGCIVALSSLILLKL